MTLDRKILFNGSLCGIVIKDNPPSDSIIRLNWKELNNPNYQSYDLLLFLHKNVLPICLENHKRKTIIDLLPKHENKGYFHIVRFYSLNRVSISLTNDGEICCRFSYQKFKHKKIYIVIAFFTLNIYNLSSGRDLDEKKTNILKFDILKSLLSNFLLRTILKEFRNKPIRSFVNFLGCKVIDFLRMHSDNFLSVDLEEEQWKFRKIYKFKNM